MTNDFGLKNLYRNVDGKRFEDVTKKLGAEDRGYGMSAAWGDFDGDGRADLYTTGTYTQWGFLHEYPGLPVPLPGRIFRPVAISWMEKMCRGNSLLLQTAKGPFEDATGRSGAGRAGWNWSVAAADLDNDGSLDLYATNGMWDDGRAHDRELEFWWETLAYWDDYIAMKRTFDRRGAGVQGIERDAYFRNRGPGASPSSKSGPFSTASISRRTDAPSWPSTRTATARSTSTCAPSRRPRRSSSEAARARRPSTSSGFVSRGRPGRTTRTASARESRRRCPAGAPRRGERLRERLSRDGQSDRAPRARSGDANREARRALALGHRAGSRRRLFGRPDAHRGRGRRFAVTSRP